LASGDNLLAVSKAVVMAKLGEETRDEVKRAELIGVFVKRVALEPRIALGNIAEEASALVIKPVDWEV